MSEGCLNLMQKSIELNKLDDRVSTMHFRWGREEADKLANTYDLVIGSDIVYEAAVFPYLIDTIIGLAAKYTYLCLTDHGNVKDFLELLKQKSEILQFEILSQDWFDEVYRADDIIVICI